MKKLIYQLIVVTCLHSLSCIDSSAQSVNNHLFSIDFDAKSENLDIIPFIPSVVSNNYVIALEYNNGPNLVKFKENSIVEKRIKLSPEIIPYRTVKNQLRINGVFLFGGKLYVSYKFNSETKLFYYVAQFSLEDLTPIGEPILLLSHQFEEEYNKGDIEMSFADSSASYLVLCETLPLGKANFETSERFVVFDEDLKKIHTHNFEGATEKYVVELYQSTVDKEGNLFYLSGITEYEVKAKAKRNDINYTATKKYYFGKIDIEKKETEELEIELEDESSIISAEFYFDSNQVAHIAGLYESNGLGCNCPASKKSSGFFSVTLNMNEFYIENDSYMKYDEGFFSVASQGQTKRFTRVGGLFSTPAREIIQARKGVFCLFESRIWGAFGEYYEEIIVLYVDEKGEVEWYKTIEKNQSTQQMDVNEYSPSQQMDANEYSFFAFGSDDNLVILFMAPAKSVTAYRSQKVEDKKEYLFVASLNTEQEFRIEALYSKNEYKYIPFVKSAICLDDNTFFIPHRKGKHDKYAVLKLAK